MDDCAAQIKKWANDPIVAELFFNARHKWITSIYSMQDDSLLVPPIRKNTFNAIFSESSCAIAYFRRLTNALPPELSKLGIRMAQELFRTRADGASNFNKMVYSRMDRTAPLRYIRAEASVLRPFRFGCDALWKLCMRVPVDKKAVEKERAANPFYSSFDLA
jgi:hypothetical protein